MRRGRPGSGEPGDEPDVRFTLANERTFLAWNQVALALIAAGLAISEFVPSDFAVDGGVLGLPPTLMAGWIAFAAYQQWQANQRAIRAGDPLPRSSLPLVFSAFTAGGALVATLLILLERT